MTLGRLAGLLLTLVLLAALPEARAQQAAGQSAAATESELATREAISQMNAGGNAIDAAVTAALVAGVAQPVSSGIGGGGFSLVWLGAERKAFLLDFRETAPAGIDAAAFESRPFAHEQRGKLVGVPGEVAGLFELHKRFGKRRWSDVVAPAVRAAKGGFAIGQHLGAMLASSEKAVRADPGMAAVFLLGGKPAAAGRRVTNPKLAQTLERIAAEGPPAFYNGPVAADLVEATRRAGGALKLEELESYKPVEREPLVVRWEGHEVYTMPPPSAGGLMLAQTLGLYSSAELRKLGWGSGAYQHMLAEAMRGAIADRMRKLGDPDVVQVDTAGLLHPKRLAARKKKLALDRTHALPRFGLEGHGTHHLITADAAGNVVSLTTTVNRAFGAKLTAPASGVLLNDELDDFTKAADVAAFGMTESPNRPRPGARPLSSMTPTIVVKDGRAVLALGGSGGPLIATNVTQVALSRLVFGKDPLAAVSAPRFAVPTQGAFISLPAGADPALVKDLEERGELVGTLRFNTHAVQMIAIDGGRKLPAADPRKHGSAAAR
jgi:gamma-glutamyltranspeptidase / glutathione hydrolase